MKHLRLFLLLLFLIPVLLQGQQIVVEGAKYTYIGTIIPQSDGSLWFLSDREFGLDAISMMIHVAPDGSILSRHGYTGFNVASAVQLPDKDFVTVGTIKLSSQSSSSSVPYIVRVDTLGDVKWAQIHTVGAWGHSQSIVLTPDSTLLVARQGDGIEVMELSLDGEVIEAWKYTLAPFAGLISMSMFPDGSLIFMGREVDVDPAKGTLTIKASLLKTDSQRNVQWAKSFITKPIIGVFDMALGSDGTIAVVEGRAGIAADSLIVLTIDGEGNPTQATLLEMWFNPFVGETPDGVRIAPAEDGFYIVTSGSLERADTNNFSVIRTDNSGNIQWVQEYGEPERREFVLQAAATPEGVAGVGLSIPSGSNFETTDLTFFWTGESTDTCDLFPRVYNPSFSSLPVTVEEVVATRDTVVTGLEPYPDAGLELVDFLESRVVCALSSVSEQEEAGEREVARRIICKRGENVRLKAESSTHLNQVLIYDFLGHLLAQIPGESLGMESDGTYVLGLPSDLSGGCQVILESKSGSRAYTVLVR